MEQVSVVGISIEDSSYRRFVIKPVFRRTSECWPESEAWSVMAWWWSPSDQVICCPVGISHGIISEPKKISFCKHWWRDWRIITFCSKFLTVWEGSREGWRENSCHCRTLLPPRELSLLQLLLRIPESHSYLLKCHTQPQQPHGLHNYRAEGLVKMFIQ